MDTSNVRGLSRRFRIVLALAVVAALLFPVPALGTHDGFHRYSVGRESTGGSGFTGVSVYRVDKAMTGIPNDGCSAPVTGHPVYQSQWVYWNAGGTSWIEVGTGHQCNDSYRYWYWGYGPNGNWVLTGSQTGISNGSWHTFKIERVFDDSVNRYQWRVDGVLKGTYTNSSSGPKVQAGLESYAAGATVGGHNYTTLAYQKLGGTFYNWVGQDGLLIDDPLCGEWVAAISWRAGQGAGQC